MTPVGYTIGDKLKQKSNNFRNFVFSLPELTKVRDEIYNWQQTNSGINSHQADKIVDAIINLCQAVKNYDNYTTDVKLISVEDTIINKDHPYHPESLFENYSEPIQTGINQWSVFVRKVKGMKEVIGVTEHRFKEEQAAKNFSINNWNLGDYY